MDYFGKDESGETIMHWDLKCMRNDGYAGAIMRVSAYGAAILNLWVFPTESESNNGIYDYQDLVLGWENLKEYEKNDPYFGVVVGRVAGRINHGKIKVGDKTYELDKSAGENFCLHGGKNACSHKKWELRKYDSNYIKLEHTAKNENDGFPGTLTLTIEYTLSYDQEKNTADVLIQYTGKLEGEDCPINPTNHTYWNIAGHQMGAEAIKRQKAEIKADRILELDEKLIPTGKTIELEGHPKDFTNMKSFEDVISKGGYDDYYIFVKKLEKEQVINTSEEPVIKVVDEVANRMLECWTDQPGAQIYTGNFIGPELEPAKHKQRYEKFGGLCIETQGFPDATNNPDFPSCLAIPGDNAYSQTTLYRITNL